MILSNIKPRCRISGLGRKSASDILSSFPCCSNVIHLISNPMPQLLSSFTKTALCQQNKWWYCCSKQETGPKEHSSPSLCFGFILWTRHSAEMKMSPLEDTCHEKFGASHWEQPLFSSRPSYHCSKRLWLPSSKLHPNNVTWGPAEPSTATFTMQASLALLAS